MKSFVRFLTILACGFVLFLELTAKADSVTVDPPQWHGHPIFAGAPWIVSNTNTILVDKVCEAMGYKDSLSSTTTFDTFNGDKELAFVGVKDGGGATFYLSKPGSSEKSVDVGYLTKLECEN